ncbi:hypothetical protein O6H91_06G140500 [Diphasiastrum complanatum]|uniref:Uncharacterized protein n=1 Tax=Diphasiastrum complanatum TaxID=34168 RepID=A0ACC2DJU5_DIPCM|nr:hypothetical protein O6H91_06G140500 [Diphasiastrum complanatum]
MMDRLLAIEPNELTIHFEAGRKSSGLLHVRNLMHTMPVAFKVQTTAPKKYVAKPSTGIIPPLGVTTVEITSSLRSELPEDYPFTSDKLIVKSVLVPGDSAHQDCISSEWFSSKKKQVFTDAGLKIMMVGGGILRSLVSAASMEYVREVLERDVDVNSLDELGNTAMHIAISKRRPEMVQLLMEFGCNLERANKSGYTALHEAAMVGDALVTELLLNRGASIDARTPSGHTAIHHAVGRGHLEVVRILLEKGADINATSKDGKSALYIAAVNGDRKVMKLLMENGADVEARGPDGSTALHKAAAGGQLAMVMLLLTWGAEVDVLNCEGKTPYNLAAASGHENLYDMLKMGNMFRSAARRGDLKTVRQFLSQGAQVNGQDQHGWTALHCAAFKGHTEIVSYLIEKKADVESVDEEGYTPLHCATEAGRKDIVQLLISKGVDLDVKMKHGFTALQIASSLNSPSLTRILSEGRARRLVSESVRGSMSASNQKDTALVQKIRSSRIPSISKLSVQYRCATVA